MSKYCPLKRTFKLGLPVLKISLQRRHVPLATTSRASHYLCSRESITTLQSIQTIDDKYDIFIGCLDILPIAIGEIVIVFLSRLLFTKSGNGSGRNDEQFRRI